MKRKVNVRPHKRKTKKGYVPVRKHCKHLKGSKSKQLMCEGDLLIAQGNKTKNRTDKSKLYKGGINKIYQAKALEIADEYSKKEKNYGSAPARKKTKIISKHSFEADEKGLTNQGITLSEYKNFGSGFQLSNKERIMLKKISSGEPLTDEEMAIWDNPLKSVNLGSDWRTVEWKDVNSKKHRANIPKDAIPIVEKNVMESGGVIKKIKNFGSNVMSEVWPANLTEDERGYVRFKRRY